MGKNKTRFLCFVLKVDMKVQSDVHGVSAIIASAYSTFIGFISQKLSIMVSIVTDVQVRNFERSFFKMWNLYCSGAHPQPFKVFEDDVQFPNNQ